MKKNFSGGARGGKETGGSGGRRGRRAVPGGRGETEAPRPRRRIGAHSGGRAKPEAPRLENRRDRADRDEIFSREDSSSDFCWGRNPVISLLEDDPSRCLKVVVSRTMQRSTASKIVGLCRASNIPYSFVETRAMDGIIKGGSHQGVIATVSPTRLFTLEEAVRMIPPPPERALVVLLDHVQDPHNLGAMIRSAEAASALVVALPLRRGSLPTGTVAKTSAGASLRLPIASVGNVANAIREFQEAGMWAVGLDAGAGETIYRGALPARVVMLVGSEESGLSRTASAACDELRSIPISGKTGSLNAAVALSLGMFEWARVNCSIRSER